MVYSCEGRRIRYNLIEGYLLMAAFRLSSSRWARRSTHASSAYSDHEGLRGDGQSRENIRCLIKENQGAGCPERGRPSFCREENSQHQYSVANANVCE